MIEYLTELMLQKPNAIRHSQMAIIIILRVIQKLILNSNVSHIVSNYFSAFLVCAAIFNKDMRMVNVVSDPISESILLFIGRQN